MALIRHEVTDLLYRWREALVAVGVACLGLWVATRGGWLLAGGGILILALAASLFWSAVQRLRLTPEGVGPGIVEIDEGQIAWYGPGIGGFVSLPEVSEIGLVTVQGLRVWRLRQADGQLLLIPLGATGIDGLFDALTALPGLDIQRLVEASEASQDIPVLWRRHSATVVRLGRA